MADLRSTTKIPGDLIATLTKLPRLQAQLRDMSQDVAIGLPEAVAEVRGQPFLLAEASDALPLGRTLGVGGGLSIADGGAGGAFEIRLQEFLAALALLSGTGFVVKTAGGAGLRNIQGGSARVTVLNGDGEGGNPQVDVDEPSLDLGNMGGTLGVAHGGTGVTVLSAFSAHNNGVAQSLPSGAATPLGLSSLDFNLNGNFAASEWTPPAGRPITFSAAVRVVMTAPGSLMMGIYKNGVVLKRSGGLVGAGDYSVQLSCIDIPNGTDAYNLRVFQDTGVTQNTVGTPHSTYFQGSML